MLYLVLHLVHYPLPCLNLANGSPGGGSCVFALLWCGFRPGVVDKISRRAQCASGDPKWLEAFARGCAARQIASDLGTGRVLVSKICGLQCMTEAANLLVERSAQLAEKARGQPRAPQTLLVPSTHAWVRATGRSFDIKQSRPTQDRTVVMLERLFRHCSMAALMPWRAHIKSTALHTQRSQLDLFSKRARAITATAHGATATSCCCCCYYCFWCDCRLVL